MQATADLLKETLSKRHTLLSAQSSTILLMSTFNVESNDPISGEFIGAIILCLFCNMCLSTFENITRSETYSSHLARYFIFHICLQCRGHRKQSISTLVPLSVAPFLMFPNKIGTILCFFNLILDIILKGY